MATLNFRRHPQRGSLTHPRNIDSFPTEILTEVLLYASLSSHNTFGELCRLARVSPLWLSIIASFPDFWQRLDMDYKRRTWTQAGSGRVTLPRLYRDAKAFFNQAKKVKEGVPRTLVLKTAYNDGLEDLVYSDLDALKANVGVEGWLEQETIDMIHCADVCLDPVEALNVFVMFDFPPSPSIPVRSRTTWTQLTTLSLNATWGQRMPFDLEAAVLEDCQVATSMPRLTDLTLATYGVRPWAFILPFPQLKKLKFRACEEVFVEEIHLLLSLCQDNLEECYIQAGASFSDVTPLDPRDIKLRSLKKLDLFLNIEYPAIPDFSPGCEMGWLLEAIQAPEARSVSVRSFGPLYTQEWSFSSFIQNCKHLQELRLSHCKLWARGETTTSFRCSPEVYLEVLRGLPSSLETLSLLIFAEEDFPADLGWIRAGITECGTLLPKLSNFDVRIYVPIRHADSDRYPVLLGQVSADMFLFARAREVGHARLLPNAANPVRPPCNCTRRLNYKCSLTSCSSEIEEWHEDFPIFESEDESDDEEDVETDDAA